MQRFKVPSSSEDLVYDVTLDPNSCTCPDYRHRQRDCKHIFAVQQRPDLFVQDGEFLESEKVQLGPTPLPMLAKPYTGWPRTVKELAVEEKFDGLRMMARVHKNGNVDVWSRTGKTDGTVKRQFSSAMREELRKLPPCVLDGEIAEREGRSTSAGATRLGSRLKFMVFDVVEVMGKAVVNQPMSQRRKWLEQLLTLCSDPVLPTMQYVVASQQEMDAVVENIWDNGGEGVIVNPLGAKYSPGKRTDAYMKIKALESAALTVVGFCESKGEIMQRGPAAITVLKDDDGNYTVVKTLDNNTCNELSELFVDECWEERKIAGKWVRYNTAHQYVGRKLRIEFHERTPDRSYRHGRWDRWEDE